MPLHFLDDHIWFPPVEDALEDGLLAIGGDLSISRLLHAYEKGIFPWYNEGEIPMWWSPDPRFVLFPSELKVSKSMKQIARSGNYEFRINVAFEQVINYCKTAYRKGQDGTWISNDVINAYIALHHRGYAHSAECWKNGVLVGGLYGILLGRTFFGESMFSHESNSSKYAFIEWIKLLKAQKVDIVDCQVYTPHLESLGARMIRRADFIKMIEKGLLA